jgi:enoyl-CoA hydratase
VRWPWELHHKPVIGAINGAAVAGGFELALHCDFLVASERAVFADTHTRVGQIPGAGLSILLPEAVGLRRARELSFTGNFFTAEQAMSYGLVNHVVAHDELLPTARRIAADIVANHGPATRALHHLFEAMQDTVWRDAWRMQDRLAREWQAGFQPDEVAARRGGIMSRSREQRMRIEDAAD